MFRLGKFTNTKKREEGHDNTKILDYLFTVKSQ